MYMDQKTAAKYGNWKLIRLKGEIGKSTVVVGNISTPLSTINRTIRQKIIKDIEELDVLSIKRI